MPWGTPHAEAHLYMLEWNHTLNAPGKESMFLSPKAKRVR